ncbi:hypothetical protein HOY80DRAFT_1114707 [Tuber brumale]|nr:hypothetical protein HOY80DRAFT_1114707 [Tuber brumale]
MVLNGFLTGHRCTLDSVLRWCNHSLNNCVRTEFSGGHGVIGDPDAEIVDNETIAWPRQWKYAAIAKAVMVVGVVPYNRTTAKTMVQLSLTERFELKVSDALHHGKPVIATGTGGIPLQVGHAKFVFLVDIGDTDSFANNVFNLSTNDDPYARISDQAKASLQLAAAAKVATGEGLAPGSRWVMDQQMEEAYQNYVESTDAPA